MTAVTQAHKSIASIRKLIPSQPSKKEPHGIDLFFAVDHLGQRANVLHPQIGLDLKDGCGLMFATDNWFVASEKE